MKNIYFKICLVILFLSSNIILSQNATIDYSTFSSNFCNIFSNIISVSGIQHQTSIGQPKFNNNNKSVILEYNYNNNAQKGTSYKIYYNFKKDYSYKVIITARNTVNTTVATELKTSFGDVGFSSFCNGPENVSSIANNISVVSGQVSGATFVDYERTTGQLSASQSCLRLTTYSTFLNVLPQLQAIEIKKIQIIETPPPPTFSLSPSTVSVGCSSTTPVTFSVNNVYSSPGTLTYIWSATGWNYNGVAVNSFSTTTNTITLVPNSYLPSNVYVTPILNGVAQQQKTASVTLAPFSNTIVITGNNAICPSTSAVYSISNLGSGSTISWSTSNTSIATVTTTTGNQTTVNTIASQGTFDLIASITNACGQQKTLTKTLSIGQPKFQINYTPRDLYVDLTLSPEYGSAALYEQGVDINTISWDKVSQEGGNVSLTGNGIYGTILFPNNNSSITINVLMTNSCGTTSYPLTLMSGYADSRTGNLQPSINKISNDLYEVINLPEDTNKFKISVYDIYGGLIFKTNTTNQINLSSVKAGIYIIKAESKDKTITLKIIKE